MFANLIYVDWMIGSANLDIDRIIATGTAEPLMRRGEYI
jgi:aminopeptidase